MTLSKTSVSLIGTAQSCFSATTDLLQSSVSSSSSNSSIAGTTGSGSMSTGSKNICAVGKNAFGTATITVSLTPTDTANYNSVSKTASVSTKILVTMPSCNNLTYNGTTQALVPSVANLVLSSGSGMGPSGKDAGTYTVVGSPENGYAFSDGAANKSVICTIAKADPTLSFTSSGIIIGNRSVTLYAKPNIAGSLSVSSSNASITASGSGSVAANGQKGFPVSANNVSGSSTITVKFTPTDTKNYNTKTATATVTAYKEASPGSCVANLRYTGSNQTVVSGGVGVTYTTTSFSSVGVHRVTAAANGGYLFSDNTGSKLLECTIGKALASTGSCQSLTYTGSSQTLMLHGVGVTYSNNSRTAAGSQDVTINAITNYEFSDGTTSKKVSCSISKATATTGTCADLTYNGESRVLMSGGTGVTYSNNSRTAAGSQTVTINADSNHVFSDGTSSKTKDCTIKPATASYGSCNSLSYNGSAQTLASGASNATYSNNTRTSAGSQNVTVTANTNYAFSDGSTSKTLSCSIARAQNANPGTCKTGLVYNGSAQTLMSGGTSVTYSNNSRTAAGSQTVTVNADSNHAFVGGSTSTTVSCSIGKKAATITAPSCTIEYDGTSHTCGGASSCTVTGLVGSDSPSLSCGTTTKTAMGSYTVTAGGSISDNYSITYTI